MDTGLGFERVLYIINNQNSVFDTELFQPIIKKISELSGIDYYSTSDENIFSPPPASPAIDQEKVRPSAWEL